MVVERLVLIHCLGSELNAAANYLSLLALAHCHVATRITRWLHHLGRWLMEASTITLLDIRWWSSSYQQSGKVGRLSDDLPFPADQQGSSNPQSSEKYGASVLFTYETASQMSKNLGSRQFSGRYWLSLAYASSVRHFHATPLRLLVPELRYG